ncbi:hypothetical protein H4W28_001930 [Micrococcus yunnanensis]|nr:hypothetical protein [Micrococcus yunnanensis]
MGSHRPTTWRLHATELFGLSGVRERIGSKKHPVKRPPMSTATLSTKTPDKSAAVPALLVVSYLRVSRRLQAERGGT